MTTKTFGPVLGMPPGAQPPSLCELRSFAPGQSTPVMSQWCF